MADWIDSAYGAYAAFNDVEGGLWILIAIALPFAVSAKTRRERSAIAGASLGFVVFGISDFFEARYAGHLPFWLWAYKALCAGFLLSCRYWYIGWKQFRLTDHLVVFGFCCLCVWIGILLLQYWLSGACAVPHAGGGTPPAGAAWT